jgi:uncharacterized membrane protein
LKTWSAPWLFWALLSAIFAAVPANFAKIGVANINVIRAAILALTKQYQPPASISTRSYTGLPGFANFAP